jgi:cystathionine beta-lyase/cystathionine gamma-synthase
MKTYFLRYEAQSAAAMQVAAWLEEQPAVARVHYPGLASHPRHALARRQMRDYGAVVTFDLRGGMEEAREVVESLELFAVAASLGSVDSLVMPPQLMQPKDFTAEQVSLSAVTRSTIRLCIGAEDPDDLVADLRQALARI